jgi:hypothetical protein
MFLIIHFNEFSKYIVTYTLFLERRKIMFGLKKKSSNTKTIQLVVTDKEVEYGSVIGFFEFRGEIFFRAKGSAGKKISDFTTSFTDAIKEKYPDEFGKILSTEVSALKVIPLKVVE